MAFFLAVTQAPHASFYNGGTDSAARQYFARRTQHTANGPRIPAAISGMSPGEFRTVLADATGDIFMVRSASTGATFNTLDWTPRAAWDAATDQIVVGGRRGLTKLIAYSDVTGEWRELPMPLDWGRIIQGTVHYYGLCDEDDSGQIYLGNTESVGKTWRFWPVTESFTRRADHITTNGGNGAMFAWSPDANGGAGGLIKYAGDAQRWLIYDPATNTWSNPANNLGHGAHALLEYSTVAGKFLLVGGTNTSTRASVVTNAGVVTQVTDVPQEISTNDGSWIVAHPSGCWLVRGTPTTGTRNLYAYWPDQDTWQNLGASPDASLTYSTVAVDYARNTIFIIATSGLYAFAFPTVVPPGGGMATSETGPDVFASAGSVRVAGALAVTEFGADGFASTGFGAITGSFDVTESPGADALAGSGNVIVAGTLDITESGGDLFTAGGGNIAIGNLNVSETGDDVFAASGTVAFPSIFGSLGAVESGFDSASSTGNVPIAGSISATESSFDIASILGPISFKLSASRIRIDNTVTIRRPKATA